MNKCHKIYLYICTQLKPLDVKSASRMSSIYRGEMGNMSPDRTPRPIAFILYETAALVGRIRTLSLAATSRLAHLLASRVSGVSTKTPSKCWNFGRRASSASMLASLTSMSNVDSLRKQIHFTVPTVVSRGASAVGGV